MFYSEVTVTNIVGVQSRPATQFVNKANDYSSSVWIERSQRRVNGKNLVSVLSLEIKKNDIIRIIADGDDEQQAVEELANMVKSEFVA